MIEIFLLEQLVAFAKTGTLSLAALVWAVYSILSRKISSLGYPVVLTTEGLFSTDSCL